MKNLGVMALLAVAAVGQPRYEVVLKGGRVVDPKNGIEARRDVAIADGKIAAVAEEIPAQQAAMAIDVSGLVVTAGLIDIHTHLFTTSGFNNAWAGDLSVRPDDYSFRTGVTTMADAGSSGWRNFEDFRHTVIDRAKTRVFAFINIAGLGMLLNFAEQHPEEMNPVEVARLAKKHSDVVVGVKTAHYEAPDWQAVDKALEAGRLAGIPIMVDFGFFRAERPYWRLVTERLRPGDISTHVYRGPAPFLDESGKLYPYLQEARARGVKFDVGHGGGSIAFRNSAPAVAQGFWPDSISTDLHTGSSNGAMQDMPNVMSKFLAMGMPLREVVARSTYGAAELIHHPELGHLTVGSVADVAVWKVMEGEFGFADVHGGRITGRQRLLCELTLKDGKVMWDYNARTATDYKKLPADYGIRGGEVVVRPPQR